MNGDIFDSKGFHVGVVIGPAIFDLKGKKLYDLKGTVRVPLIAGLTSPCNELCSPPIFQEAAD